MKDISNRHDINLIVTKFYEKLILDKEINHFFSDILNKNELNQHIVVITDFWDDVLFDNVNYQNNVMQKHLNVVKKTPFNKDTFNRWLLYLHETIDKKFKGVNAERMKNRATSIATIMQIKMNVY